MTEHAYASPAATWLKLTLWHTHTWELPGATSVALPQAHFIYWMILSKCQANTISFYEVHKANVFSSRQGVIWHWFFYPNSTDTSSLFSPPCLNLLNLLDFILSLTLSESSSSSSVSFFLCDLFYPSVLHLSFHLSSRPCLFWFSPFVLPWHHVSLPSFYLYFCPCYVFTPANLFFRQSFNASSLWISFPNLFCPFFQQSLGPFITLHPFPLSVLLQCCFSHVYKHWKELHYPVAWNSVCLCVCI